MGEADSEGIRLVGTTVGSCLVGRTDSTLDFIDKIKSFFDYVFMVG